MSSWGSSLFEITKNSGDLDFDEPVHTPRHISFLKAALAGVSLSIFDSGALSVIEEASVWKSSMAMESWKFHGFQNGSPDQFRTRADAVLSFALAIDPRQSFNFYSSDDELYLDIGRGARTLTFAFSEDATQAIYRRDIESYEPTSIILPIFPSRREIESIVRDFLSSNRSTTQWQLIQEPSYLDASAPRMSTMRKGASVVSYLRDSSKNDRALTYQWI